MIAREQLVDEHVVVVFLGILTRGSTEYEDRFLKSSTRDSFCNAQFGPPLTDEALKAFVAEQTREDPPPQKPRPNEEESRILFEVLAGPVGATDDCFICESQEWVRRTQEERVQDRLLLLQSSLHQIVEGRVDNALTYLSAPGGEISIVYRHFPSCKKLFLAGLIPGDSGKSRRDIEASHAALFTADESADANELIKRYSERGYPSTILYGTDEWLAIEKERGANLALSKEETDVLKSARQVYTKDGGYPLFVNGRAGSGKSTILQYLFEEYLFNALFRSGDQSRVLPVYFACSDSLLRTSRLVVENLIRCSYQRQLGGVDVAERDRILREKKDLVQKCFQEFHEYLFSLLPPGDRSSRFNRRRRIDFGRFKELWRARFASWADLPGWNAEVCWHALRSYIKGFSVDDYLEPDEFGELPKAERTVTEATYKRIFHEVWVGWYRDLCERDGFWDDQDLARTILNQNLVSGCFSGVFCDEAQDFTRLEVELIHRMCLFSDRTLFPQEVRQVPFVFAGDPFQTLNPTGFRWEAITATFHEKLIKNLDPSNRAKAAVRYAELNYNYRSTANIVRFCNLVQALRKVLFDLSDAELRPQTHWKLEPNSPVPVSYDKDKDASEIRAFLGSQTDVTIIVPCDEGEEVTYVESDPILREVLKRDDKNVPQNVLSSVRAKGLEFNRVVLYGFGDAAPAGLLHPISGGETYSADRDRSLPFEYFMNRLYVGASRPRRRLFVIDSAHALANFWAFAREETVRDCILRMIGEPETWRDHLCLLHPGLPKAWAEEREDPAANAEKYEEEGMRAGDPYWLRAAALQYESAGNSVKMRFCRAMAHFYEKNWLTAGSELQDCGYYDRALIAYWNDGGNEALQRLRALGNLDPRVRTRIEWQLAEWESGGKSIATTLQMTHTIQEALTDMSVAGRMSDDKTLLDFVGKLFAALATTRADAALLGVWKSVSDLLQGLVRLGAKVNDDARAMIGYRAGDHAAALEIWNKSGKTAHPEYRRAVALTSPYPKNLQFFSELGEHQRVVEQFDENKNASIAPAQLKHVVKALLATGDPERASRVSLERGDGRLASETWLVVAPGLSEAVRQESARKVLDLLLDEDDWRGGIELVNNVSDQLHSLDLSLSLQAHLIWAMALSASLPSKPTEIQTAVSDYLSAVFVDESRPRPPAVSNRVAGAAIERSGRIVAALQFYEKLFVPASEATGAEKFSARARWVKVKIRQADYEKGKGNAKNAERAHNEALRVLNDLPLDKDPAKIPEYPSLSDDDKPQPRRPPVEITGVDYLVNTDRGGEILKWSVGPFDFTYNQTRRFVVITSSTDGNTIRIDLGESTLNTSLSSGSETSPKRYFKEWTLSVDMTKLRSDRHIVIEVGELGARVLVRLDTPARESAT
jgi:superfamily I DNA/RNA helicase